MSLVRAVATENKLKNLEPRPFGTEQAACTFDILIKLDNFRDKIDSKFKSLKRSFFWQLRTLYQMEENILQDK